MRPNDRRYLVLLSHISLARLNGVNPFAHCWKISCPMIITDRSLSELRFALGICDVQNKLTKHFAT